VNRTILGIISIAGSVSATLMLIALGYAVDVHASQAVTITLLVGMISSLFVGMVGIILGYAQSN